VLNAMNYAPAVLVGLFAGVWVDRLRRRPILISADLLRGALLLILPIAAFWGLLHIELLYIVAFGMGVLGVFGDAAYGAFLPVIVPRDQLVTANSRLSASTSVAQIAGPGLAGILVQMLTAPGAVVVDALSFLMSACSLQAIRGPEPAPMRSRAERHFWHEIGDGLRTIWRNPYLRTIQLSSFTGDIFWNALYAVYILYVTQILRLPPSALGLIFGIGSAGGLLGSLIADRVARRLGIGPTMILMQALVGAGSLMIGLSVGLRSIALPILIGAELLQSGTNVIYGITWGSLNQAVVPDELRGRVGGTRRFIGLAPAMVGLLLGGLLGEWFGVPAMIIIGSTGGVFAVLWLVFSPLRELRRL
jgi:MFS family permease